MHVERNDTIDSAIELLVLICTIFLVALISSNSNERFQLSESERKMLFILPVIKDRMLMLSYLI